MVALTGPLVGATPTVAAADVDKVRIGLLGPIERTGERKRLEG